MIANRANSAQLGSIPYHSPKLHLGPCNSVGMRPRTDRQTHRRTWPQCISHRLRLTRNVMIQFSSMWIRSSTLTIRSVYKNSRNRDSIYQISGAWVGFWGRR